MAIRMHRKKILLIVLALVAFGAALFIYLHLKAKPVYSPAPTPNIDTSSVESEIAQEEEKPPQYDVQPLIDAWAAQQSGKASVVVYDLENDMVIGSLNPDEVYFAASIYKLYVAYEGYLALQRGTHDPSEIHVAGQTRAECLDKMIRESDSPCAEKLWNELGKDETTATLQTYGITNTSMAGVTTTAGDAATMLVRLHQNDEMNDTYKQALLDSMKEQIYRDALAASFKDVIFYDKVGFNGLQEYHDVGILELPNGRHYVVSVFTDSVGTRAMRTLGDQLLGKLNVQE